jgi:RNA polymerase-binding transcription factor DksA
MAMNRSEHQWPSRLENNGSELAALTRSVQSAGQATAAGSPEAPPTSNYEMATSMIDRVSTEAMLSLLAQNREQVERALERLEVGLYGYCETAVGGSPRSGCASARRRLAALTASRGSRTFNVSRSAQSGSNSPHSQFRAGQWCPWDEDSTLRAGFRNRLSITAVASFRASRQICADCRVWWN